MSQQNFIPQGGFFDWQQGMIGTAILGNSAKFNSDLYNYYSPMAQQPILVDISPGQLMKIACSVPHLNVVISKLCTMFTQMEIKHVNKEGVEIEKSDVIKLLLNPNPMQMLEGFLYDYSLNHFIYNCEFIFKNYATASRIISPLPKTISLMPSGLMRVNMTGKPFYRAFDLKTVIDSFTMIYDPQPLTVDEIIFISEAFSINGTVAKSKIEALQIPLSNIVASLKLFNIIASEGRMIGAVTPDNTGSNENTPPSSDTMANIQKDYNLRFNPDGRHGHIGFPTASVKWIPFEFDVQKLMLLEGLENDFALICAAMGADRQIFPSSIMASKGLTTGLEKNEGHRITYQNTLQPIANKLMNVLMDHLFTDKQKGNGEKLVASYQHLPVMQQDALVTAQAMLTESQRNLLLYNANIINADAWAEMEEIELTGTATDYEPPAPSFGNFPPKPDPNAKD